MKAKKNRLIILVGIAYLATSIYDPKLSLEALKVTGSYLREMLEVMPAIFVLSSLITIWVHREVIIRNFGGNSGLRGKLASLLLGSVSAGPIYAAFPLTLSLLKKGASIGNIVIMISSWAVIKVPMLFVEAKFLGIKFAVSRYLLTVPCILLMGVLCDKLLTREEVLEATKDEEDNLKTRILEALPGYNCGTCGFRDCNECAKAIALGEATREVCKPGGEDVGQKIESLMNASYK